MSDADEDGQAAARHAAAIAELLARVQAEVTGAAALVDVAEDEIGQAAARHPQAADHLFHSFRLLLPAFDARAWGTEFVLRAHCRELLERVARGEDTRPGTNAECLLAISQVAVEVPLNGAAAGFCFRMWSGAFPGHELSDRGQHYEALYGSAIDDIERWTRAKLAIPGRVLRDITCDGLHHGQPAACRYRAEAQP
ncbi:MAG: hypothetical protein ACRDRJ_15140 [Streptosporangiaceae bacterium]